MNLADLHPARLMQTLLRTRLVWRLSGLTYWSAVKATRGRVMKRADLLRMCEERIAFIFPHLAPEHRVLDFGCGLGGVAVAMSRHAGEVIGVDINRLFIRHARRMARGRDNCRFQFYSGQSLPFDDADFDVVCCWGVFERIPKPSVTDYVREFHRVLKPEGLAVVYLLRRNAEAIGLTDLLGVDAYVFFAQDEADRLFASAGFKIQEYFQRPAAHVYLVRKKV